MCQPVPVWYNIVVNTSAVVVGTQVGYRCASNYTFDDGETSKTSSCSLLGHWQPYFVECRGRGPVNLSCGYHHIVMT